MWKMFIDDERFPVDEEMIIVRSVIEAKQQIEKLGVPEFISFDHDLGDQVPTGFDLAKFIVEKDLDENGEFLPKNFSFYVHSANPVGKKNIEGLLEQYLGFKNPATKSKLKM